MKMNIKIAAMALAVVGLAVACKGKSAEPIDTTPIDTMPIVEEVVDTIDSVIAEVAEEVVATPQPAKKSTAKKQETKKSTTPNVKAASSSETTVAVPSDKSTANKMGKIAARNSEVTESKSNSNVQINNTTTTNKIQKMGNR